jgi:hypothetical protein
MAITLEANYSKKLGLPGYSSHQYSVTVRTELADLGQADQESRRLYGLLQSSVDREIQQTGYLPQAGHDGANGNGSSRPAENGEPWNCSDKQRDLILKIVDEHRLDKNEVERLAQDRFSKGVRQLNKLEASGLIDELLAQHGGNGGGPRNGQRRGHGRYQPAGRSR